MGLPEVPDGGGWVATFVGAVLGLFALRRKLSRDNLEVAKDRKGQDILDALQAERDKAIAERDKAMATARDAWNTRTADAKLIGELTAKVEHLTLVNGKLEQTVAELLAKVDSMQTKIEQMTAGGFYGN